MEVPSLHAFVIKKSLLTNNRHFRAKFYEDLMQRKNE